MNTKIIINEPCFRLKYIDGLLYSTNIGGLFQRSSDGTLIRQFPVRNINDFIQLNTTQMLLSTTSGDVFELDIKKCVTQKKFTGGSNECTDFIVLNGCIYWCSREGVLYTYNHKSNSVKKLLSLGDDLFVCNICADEKKRCIYLPAQNKSNGSVTLIAFCPESHLLKSFDLPIKKYKLGHCCCFDGVSLILYDLNKSVLIGFNPDISSKVGSLAYEYVSRKIDEPISVINLENSIMCITRNELFSIFSDMSVEYFDIEDRYLNSICCSENCVCIGSWNNGYIL